MARAVFRKMIFAGALMAAATGGVVAVPASAQFFSDGFEFLKAVKDRDGDIVTKALNEPGTIIVNTRDRSTGESALHIVTQRRDTAWVKFLTQKGANPNIADKQGVTPLQIASNLGYIDGVEVLLGAGAQVDAANSAGETPLISAVHRRDIAMLRLLLSKGANADRNDNSGRSARDYARLLNTDDRMLAEIVEADETRQSETSANAYGPSF